VLEKRVEGNISSHVKEQNVKKVCGVLSLVIPNINGNLDSSVSTVTGP
jgi:hypothetical protein